jgi:hypothetical protein
VKTNNPNNNPEQRTGAPQFIPGANVVMVPIVNLLDPRLSNEEFLRFIAASPKAALLIRHQAMAAQQHIEVLHGQVQVLQQNLGAALTDINQLNALMERRYNDASKELAVIKGQLAETQAALEVTKREPKNKFSGTSPTLSPSTSYSSLPFLPLYSVDNNIWGSPQQQRPTSKSVVSSLDNADGKKSVSPDLKSAQQTPALDAIKKKGLEY